MCESDSKTNTHTHEHHHDHEAAYVTMWVQYGLSIALFAFGLIADLDQVVELTIFLISYLLIGGEVILRAVKNLFRGKVFDENFLMSIATIGAFVIGEYAEGVAVMIFYQIGEYFQGLAVRRSKKSIVDLMDIRPDFANRKNGDVIETVSPEMVAVGELIVVKPGEKIPLDAIVVDGSSTLDTSALTGEAMPREVSIGDQILSGTINLSGLLVAQVDKTAGESTVSKILELVQNASSKKAPTEQFITKFARIYTPIVVFLALAIAVVPSLVTDAVFTDWLNRALIFLVISCPCALVLSIPVGFFGGIGGASKRGILMKGGNYLEALTNVDTVVFDKTGTLTKGQFSVTKIEPITGESTKELLEIAAYAEHYSNHPIALSIKQAFGGTVDETALADYQEIAGHGISVSIRGKKVLVGNAKLMASYHLNFTDKEQLGTIVHVTVDGVYIGYLVIADEIKDDAAGAIHSLRDAGVKRTVMLTGDNQNVANHVAGELKLDEVHAELLPDQKVAEVERLKQSMSSAGALVFVGDGINDAPVLAIADVGVAMGGLGSDAAIEAADVVLMTDEPSKLVAAIRMARRTKQIVWQNITLTMIVKGVVLILGAGGLATMWEAVFADVGVALLAVLNATRVLKGRG